MGNKPKYLMIFEDIKKQIMMGVLHQGDMLPSENGLSAKYQVSRMTVQKALRILALENIIYSIPGKGHFVNAVDANVYTIYFDETNICSNEKPQSIKPLGVEIILPTPELIYELQVPINKRIVKIKRLISLDKKIVGLDIKYIPYSTGIPIIEREINYSTFSKMLSKVASSFETDQEIKIQGIIPDEDLCNLLKINRNEAVLLIEEKFFDEEEKPIGWGQLYCNAEECILYADSDKKE